MNSSVYLSRAFVEFGPFDPTEILAFEKRGILREIDHIRHHGKDDWIPLQTWLASAKTGPKPAMATPATAPKPGTKKNAVPAKKSAPNKKAAATKKATSPVAAKKATSKKTSAGA
jgi:hypothetical protein